MDQKLIFNSSTGNDVTLVGWGSQVHVLLETADIVEQKLNTSCEVVDLVSILPWDMEAVCKVINFFSIDLFPPPSLHGK